MSRYHSKKKKEFISERAHYCCEYCQSLDYFATQDFSIEHIIPLVLKGSNGDDNLALSCQGCNNYKQIKITGFDVIEEKVVPLFNPRKQKWQDHFKWSNDFFKIEGLTPTGRVTIHTLKLNRKKLQNRRAISLIIKKHPPSHTLKE